MTRALILAAGRGSRLSHLTDHKPKCLAELGGISLIRYQVTALRKAGVNEIFVVTGYKSNVIEHHLNDDRHIEFIHNPRFASTNMVQSLFTARDVLAADDETLICYSDIVFDMNVLARVLSCPFDICVPVDEHWHQLWSMRMPDPLSDAETLKLSEDGGILEIGQKPRSLDDIEAQYIGMVKVTAAGAQSVLRAYDALDRTRMYDGQDFDNMYMTSFLTHLVSQGLHLRAVKIRGGWLEVDTVSDLSLYQDLLERGVIDELLDLEYMS